MKATHLYAINHDWLSGIYSLVEVPIVKETAKLYWLKGSAQVFSFRRKIYKCDSNVHTTPEAAITALRSRLVADRDKAQQELDNFNSTFAE